MRLGYLIDVHGGPYDQPIPDRDNVSGTLDRLIEEGIAAEEAGFHSLHVPHRHGRTETYFPGPLQLLTILARETERVALGAFSMVSTLYHPMVIAEQGAIIDNLSRGRFFTALARGYHPGYWNYFGVPQERLLGRHLDAIKIIELAMRGERFTFEGDFYSVIDSLMSPQPFQEGGFPLWGGGDSVPAMLRGVSYGQAWPASPFPIHKPSWDRRMEAYREECARLGKEPFVVLLRDGWVADTFKEAAEAFGPHYVEEMRFYQRQGILEQVHPFFDDESKITAESMREHALLGTAAQCIEQIERYQEDFGVDYVVLRTRMPTGPSFSDSLEQIRRFGAEVVSHFHERDTEALIHPAIPTGAQW